MRLTSSQHLGFNALGGATKLKLLPKPWPLDNLPSPTSSLFSVASKQGLLAAAGPDAIIIATTESVRTALDNGSSTQSNTLSFTPQLTIPAPTRISQVCFTADGNYLILSAESGGGLAVYETSSLKQGNQQPAFQIATENVSVRSIVPNPSLENAHIVAVVLSGGQLMSANLHSKEFASGASGSKIIKDAVSCASWSVKGKQIVAGLGDGTACQLDTSGAVKAMIPKPPALQGEQHLSSIVWLANDEFLFVHTPTTSQDPDMAPEPTLHFVRTNKDRSSFAFSKFAQDPAPPFGMKRFPPTHFVSRLRNWHHLLDTLIFSSVASADIGLVTKSDVALSSDVAADQITNNYTITSFVADSSRAILPMDESGTEDTSPIGMILDLSGTEKVHKPIVGDDMEESPFPLPAVMLLNNEGVLSAWWIVYDAALRENKICQSMVVASGSIASPPTSPRQVTPQAAPFGESSAPSAGFGSFAKAPASAFGQSGFGNAAARTSAWGSSTSTPAAGSAFGKPAFGQTPTSTPAAGSAFGKPAFGQTSSFGQSGFGQASTGGSGFGATGGVGGNQSPWGSKAATSNGPPAPAPAFGQTAFSKLSGGNSTSSPFGALASSTSPFAQHAKSGQSGFGTPSSSGFGTSFGTSPQHSFGSTVTIDSTTGGSTLDAKSVFGQSAQTSSFGKPSLRPESSRDEDMMDEGNKEDRKLGNGGETPSAATDKPKSGLFGLPGGAFQLGSTFKPGETAAEKDQEPSQSDKKPTLFGNDFTSSLSTSVNQDESKPIKKEPTNTTNIFNLPEKPTPATSTGSTKPAPFSFPPTPQLKQEPPARLTPMQQPEPPQVTSKPIPSPATAPSPATTKSPSADELPTLADSPQTDGSASQQSQSPAQKDDDAERTGPQDDGDSDDLVEHGLISGDEEEDDDGFEDEEDDEGEDEEESEEPGEDEEEEVDVGDMLPPDPSTVKKPSWWNQPIPGAAEQRPHPFSQTPAKPMQPAMRSHLGMAGSPTLSTSTTPAGFPKVPIPITFQPPSAAMRGVPRSPSPIRSASTPMFGGALVEHQAPKFQPRRQDNALSKTPVYAADLMDTADEDVRRYLDEPVRPDADIRKLQFQAHQDYLSKASKEGVPAQIERVYKDINSMVDTTGLNARYLSNFVAGHSESTRTDGDQDALQDGEKWTLVELHNLQNIEGDLNQEVDSYKLTEYNNMAQEMERNQRDLFKLKQELISVRRTLENKRDPEQKAAVRSAPLEPLHASKQQELRTAFATFQKQLAEAEDAALTLRTRIASAVGKSDSKAMPTVEAVENTIKKMIGMIQQRSSEVDVLEAQMRKFGIATRGGTPLRDTESLRQSLRRSVGPDDSFMSSFKKMGITSREGTPTRGLARSQLSKHQTPPQNRNGRSGYGIPDEDSDDDDNYEDARREVQPTAEVKRYLETQARRKAILSVLKQKLIDRAQGIKPEPES